MDRRTFVTGAVALALTPGALMADPAVPQNLADRLGELERRLAALERSPQLEHSSVRRGGLTVYDEDGVRAARLGQALTDTSAGAEFYASDGQTRLLQVGRSFTQVNEVSVRALQGETGGYGARFGRFGNFVAGDGTYITGLNINDLYDYTLVQISSEKGWDRPLIPLPSRKADDAYSLTSGSFVPTWRSASKLLYARYAYIEVVAGTDAGTTAEVRIVHGAVTTAVRTVPAGSAGTTLVWRWDMTGSNLFDHSFVVEARRTGGAGSVRIYDPVINLGRGDGVHTTTGI